jgi:hypothetical protein
VVCKIFSLKFYFKAEFNFLRFAKLPDGFLPRWEIGGRRPESEINDFRLGIGNWGFGIFK